MSSYEIGSLAGKIFVAVFIIVVLWKLIKRK